MRNWNAHEGLLVIAAGCLVLTAGLHAQASGEASAPKDSGATQAPASSNAAPSATAQLPAFDVVSVKPHKDEGMMMRVGMRPTPDGYEADGLPLETLVRMAFGLSQDRILNEPDWTRSARFDIAAKVAPEDAPKLKALSVQQRAAMMLPVLQDRFGLKFHHETKDMQVYTLVVAKGGPKLKEAAPAAGSAGTAQPPIKDGGVGGHAPPPPPPPGAGGGDRPMVTKPGAGPASWTGTSTFPQGMRMEGHGASMANLVQMISQQVGATVVDKTGLTGNYDFTLSFAREMGMAPMMRGGGPDSGAQPQEPVWPSIFSAVQEQLGLKLDAHKEPVDVVVIDHIEQPSEN